MMELRSLDTKNFLSEPNTEIRQQVHLSKEDIKSLDAMVHVLISDNRQAKFGIFDKAQIDAGNLAWVEYLYDAVKILREQPALRKLFQAIEKTKVNGNKQQQSRESLAKVFHTVISNFDDMMRYFCGERS